jgi:hypothetical protein
MTSASLSRDYSMSFVVRQLSNVKAIRLPHMREFLHEMIVVRACGHKIRETPPSCRESRSNATTEHTPSVKPLAAPPWLADLRESLRGPVGCIPAWHHGHVETADEVGNVEGPKSRHMSVQGYSTPLIFHPADSADCVILPPPPSITTRSADLPTSVRDMGSSSVVVRSCEVAGSAS